MSAMRKEYFRDLLNDTIAACNEAGVHAEDQGVIIAALILSDSFNGIRKALMSPGFATANALVAAQRAAFSGPNYGGAQPGGQY